MGPESRSSSVVSWYSLATLLRAFPRVDRALLASIGCCSFGALRLFHENGTPHNRQILFCSIRRPEKGREDTIAALKALSDETRYQILMLLAKHGSVNGLDIARALKLAPSTVSHHMTDLKERGLITEEPVKTAKYYGISKNTVQELLQTVERDLKLNAPEGARK